MMMTTAKATAAKAAAKRSLYSYAT